MNIKKWLFSDVVIHRGGKFGWGVRWYYGDKMVWFSCGVLAVVLDAR